MLAGFKNRDTMLKVCIEFRKTCRTLGLGCDFIRHFKEFHGHTGRQVAGICLLLLPPLCLSVEATH